MMIIAQLFHDYTLYMVIICMVMVGITAGVLGTFVLLRQQSLLSDAISHAALPGIIGAFLLTGAIDSWVIMLGGICSGCIGTLFMYLIIYKTGLKQDTALGIVLSVFFGFGLMLLTVLQKKPRASQASIQKFLLGNVSTLLPADLIAIASVGLMVLIYLCVTWKAYECITFDPSFASAHGYPVMLLNMFFTGALVCTIIIGLQTIGVILMSTMLIAPAAAARQWTNNLKIMALLAACFGVSAGIIGALLSRAFEQLPTGPMIVVLLSIIVLSSLLFAPVRGIIWHRFRSISLGNDNE
jgi:manganese/zinc/iron transport system permease protein